LTIIFNKFSYHETPSQPSQLPVGVTGIAVGFGLGLVGFWIWRDHEKAIWGD